VDQERLAWIGAVICAPVIVCAALFVCDGFPFAFDWATHVFWTEHFAWALAEGVAYPLWIGPADGGFGNPVFLYYAPVAYYVSSVLSIGLGSVTAGLKVAMLCWLALGAWGMWRFIGSASKLGVHSRALVASSYVAAPGLMILVYGDWLYANVAGLCIVPWVLFALRERSPLWHSVVALASLLLTHAVTAVLCMPLFILGVRSSRHWIHAGWHRRLLLAVTLAGGLSAVYLLPAVGMQHLVHLEVLETPEWGQAADNLIFSRSNPRGEGAWLTLNHWIGAIACLELTAIGLALWAQGWRRGAVQRSVFVLALLYWVLMSPASSFLWLQFPWLGRWIGSIPWRLLGPMTFLWAWSLAQVLEQRTQSRFNWCHKTALVAFVAGVAVSLWLIGNAPSNTVPRSHVGIARATGAWPVREYRPCHVPVDRHFRHPWTPRVTVLTPGARARVLSWGTHHRRIEWASPHDGVISLRTFDFPCWKVRGAKMRRSPSTGGVVLDVPKGEHTIEMFVIWPFERILGAIVSALVLLGLVVYSLAVRYGIL